MAPSDNGNGRPVTLQFMLTLLVLVGMAFSAWAYACSTFATKESVASMAKQLERMDNKLDTILLRRQ